MDIIVTHHAKERLLERKIPSPEGLTLKKCGSKIKARIKAQCPTMGFQGSKYVYLSYNSKFVYIFKQIDIGKLLLITSIPLNTNMKQLEYRMYGLVPYNISPIQQGIQYGHAVVEYISKYSNESLTKWMQHDKTFIILNGGTTNKKQEGGVYKGTLNNHLQTLNQNNIPNAIFLEPDLGDQLTAIVFLVDERVWDKTKYPDFKEDPLIFKKKYNTFVKQIGGEKNLFLRQFLSQFKLA